MTLSADDIDSRRSGTVTTTRELLPDLIDDIASKWAPFSTTTLEDDGPNDRDELEYLAAWRKAARRTLKRLLPYVGVYRRDVPPLHNLAEYTFPRTEYDAFERILRETERGAGPRANLYKVPTELPYIGFAGTEDPSAEEEDLSSYDDSTYSPLMIWLCLAQKATLLFEQASRGSGRPATLVEYLDTRDRQVAIELAQILETEWTRMDKGADSNSDADEPLYKVQGLTLREIEHGLDWTVVRNGGLDPGGTRSKGVLERILRQNFDYAKEHTGHGDFDTPPPHVYLPIIAKALYRHWFDGHDVPFLTSEGACDPPIVARERQSFTLGHSRGSLNQRQAAIYRVQVD